MKKSIDESSRKKGILKDFMKNFRIEERLKLYHYSSNKKCCKRWPKRLRFSLYSEACEYVKQLQREEIDFSAKIQSLRDHSLQQFNDLVTQQKKFGSAPGSIDKQREKDIQELKKEIMDLKFCIENLCYQIQT